MDRKVHSIEDAATAEEAAKAMIEKQVWSLLVMKKGIPGGVVTERDIIKRCIAKGMSPSKTSVATIASSPVISIGPDASIREAMDLMAAKDIRRLFVVSQGKIVGRVTQTELFQSTLSVMEMLSDLSSQL